jgi:hypothetical protein
VRGHTDKLAARISELEQKVVRLEAALEHKNFTYMGVWKEGKVYAPGHFVTHAGAMWHSNTYHNRARPGDGHADWTLAVKSGRGD